MPYIDVGDKVYLHSVQSVGLVVGVEEIDEQGPCIGVEEIDEQGLCIGSARKFLVKWLNGKTSTHSEHELRNFTPYLEKLKKRYEIAQSRWNRADNLNN